MKKKFVALAGVLSFALAACATAPPVHLTPLEAPLFSGRSVQLISHRRPDFLPTRPSNAAFGMLGALAAISEGQGYPESHHLVDPSARLEQRLANDLHDRFGVEVQAQPLDMTTARAGTPYPRANNTVYVDAQSIGWGFSYFSLNWVRFRVSYAVRLMVVDASTGQVIQGENCGKVSHTSADNAPSLDQLVANDSQVMNSLIESMADACLQEFEAGILPTAPATAAAAPPTPTAH